MQEDVRSHYQDARRYDLLYPKGGDLTFWAEVCRKYRPTSVLELAVGTGRVAIPLARQGADEGFTVTGVDITPEMLALAREKLSAEEQVAQAVGLTLLSGDIRHWTASEQFDMAFIAFNSILHLIEPEDREGAFASAYRALRPGGRFIVDVFSPNLALLAQAAGPAEGPVRVGAQGVVEGVELSANREIGELGERLILTVSRRYDEATQTIRARQFIESYGNGQQQGKKADDPSYHIYFSEELRLLFSQAGFQVEAVLGDYDWRPFDAGSPRIICIGRKPPA